jgi:TRAP transporter TAXI family solute receptor
VRYAAIALLVSAATVVGCGQPGELTQRISIATGGTGGVYYPYGGGIAKVISDHLDGVEATAEVTAGTVDNLKFIANGSADLGFALADSLDDAYNGSGVFTEFGAVAARAIAVLYDNHNHIVTLDGSGITSVVDLRGRVVSTGAPGSGTEVSAFRILEAAGIDPETDLRRQSLGASQSVDALRDGKVDAFFWSGGIPTGAVLDLATTPGRTIALIPNGGLLEALQTRYGDAVYHGSIVPRTTYPGLEADVATVAVSNVLVAHEGMDDQLAHGIVDALFASHDQLAAVHPMAKVLSLETAVTGSPIPFHDGAVSYYRDRGVWDREDP